MVERCVCCGEIIPEGQQTCPSCKKGGRKMANEKRLIDANALSVKVLDASYWDNRDEDVIWNLVQDAPTIDALPVVRCKDCLYFKIDPGDHLGICKCGSIATSYGGEIYPERDHFCSCGERREGE